MAGQGDVAACGRVNREVYGAPRIWLDLLEEGKRISRKRVERLMKKAGVSALIETQYTTGRCNIGLSVKGP